MVIYLLLFTLVIQFIICYYLFNKDLFSPSAILSEVFILSTLACIYNIEKWGVNLHYSTYFVITGGNLIFIIISYIIHLLFSKKKKEFEKENLTYIDISNFKCILLLIIYIVFAILYIKANLSIISLLNSSGDTTAAMNMYRRESIEGLIHLPVWLTKTGVILNLGSFVLIYIFITNTITNPKKIKNYLLLFCVLIYLISSAFTAQRTTILLAFLYSLFVVYELLNRKYKFLAKLNSKYLLLGIIVVILFFTLFGITRNLFGRTDERTVIENITYYMGNSIESLDLYIQKPIECKQFGEETFRQFRVMLSKYNLCEDTTMNNVHLEFRRDANGNSAGNIYTAYRYYIHDFGFESIIFFQIGLAIFYGIWYELLNRRELNKKIDISFIIYGWFVICLYRYSLMSTFFTFLSYFVFTHWYTFIFWKLFLNVKFKINERYL